MNLSDKRFSKFSGPPGFDNNYPAVKSITGEYSGEIGRMLADNMIEPIPVSELTQHQRSRQSFQYFRVTEMGRSAYLQDIFLRDPNAYIRANIGYLGTYKNLSYRFAVSCATGPVSMMEVRQVMAVMMASEGHIVPNRWELRLHLAPELDTILNSDPLAAEKDISLPPKRVYELLRTQYDDNFLSQYKERSYE